MEISSIFTFNPKLRHYTGLKKQYTVSFKENSLKRDTFLLNMKNNENIENQNIIVKKNEQKKLKEYTQKTNTKNEINNEQKYIESSLYWDLKYNNLL